MNRNKDEFRKEQASLSFAEKIAILEQLMERELAIAEAREKLRSQREAETKK